jgi:putative spermidine/putrescine transport system permease protein
VPLAFAFIAALGAQGLATKVLATMGFDFVDPSFLGSNAGLTVVYLYFQIPLMMLVVLPAVDGLQPSWREAAANLGAGPFTYWRRVGGPILAPSVLGGLLLLFANSFSAYATAYAISTGASRLAPVQIRFYLQGDQSGYAEVGYAIAAWMIVIALVAMGGYLLLRHRAERWRR